MCYQDLDDPRIGNAGRHELPEILMISLCTTLCGGQTAVDMAEFGVAKESFFAADKVSPAVSGKTRWGVIVL